LITTAMMRKKHTRTVFVFCMFILVILSSCRRNRTDMAWTSIDVNLPTIQGDAHLLQICRTNFVLIDTGPRATADRVIRFLKETGCSRINFIIVTHGHSDHYGGIVPLLDSGIDVGRIYFNPPDPILVAAEPRGCSMADLAEIAAAAKSRGVPITPICPNSEWDLGNGVKLETICVFDGLNTPIGRTDINDTSAILMLTHGNIKILFAADLNRRLGDYLIKTSLEKLRADILKFPHHGAEGFASDAFFHAVNPKAVVVPTPKELWLSERCARARRLTEKCRVYVNGITGNITILSDGNGFRVAR